jgi:hypothetical protein
MINLLPNAYRSKVIGEYRRRLLVVGFGLGSGVCLVGVGLLVPLHLMVHADNEAAAHEVAFGAQALSDPMLAQAAADMDQAAALYEAVADKNGASRPSVILLQLMTVRPKGLSVNSMSYTVGPKTSQIMLGGVASEREQLLQFKNALLAVPGVSSVDFPPSNLAASSTVLYSIKIQYAPPAAKGRKS